MVATLFERCMVAKGNFHPAFEYVLIDYTTENVTGDDSETEHHLRPEN